MASIGTEIVITVERRPCFVGDKRAFFHRWIDKETPILRVKINVPCSEIRRVQDEIIERFKRDKIVPQYCDMEMQKITLGLVEYEDGTVAEVEPTNIRFDVEREKEG